MEKYAGWSLSRLKARRDELEQKHGIKRSSRDGTGPAYSEWADVMEEIDYRTNPAAVALAGHRGGY